MTLFDLKYGYLIMFTEEEGKAHDENGIKYEDEAADDFFHCSRTKKNNKNKNFFLVLLKAHIWKAITLIYSQSQCIGAEIRRERIGTTRRREKSCLVRMRRNFTQSFHPFSN